MDLLLVLLIIIITYIIYIFSKSENFETRFNNNMLKKLYRIGDDLKKTETNLDISYN